VWSVTVVVACELPECGCRVSLIDDQEAVEEFAADRADEALGDRVRPWRPCRRLDDPDVDRGEDRVEGSGRSRARAAITARSVQVIRGRGRRRCSTAS